MADKNESPEENLEKFVAICAVLSLVAGRLQRLSYESPTTGIYSSHLVKNQLFSSLHAQHGRAEAVRGRSLLVALAFLAYMRSGPCNLAVLVVALVVVTLRGHVVSSIDDLAV